MYKRQVDEPGRSVLEITLHEGRLVTEAAIFADKTAIDEETCLLYTSRCV